MDLGCKFMSGEQEIVWSLPAAVLLYFIRRLRDQHMISSTAGNKISDFITVGRGRRIRDVRCKPVPWASSILFIIYKLLAQDRLSRLVHLF
jgi:hypothetical protein